MSANPSDLARRRLGFLSVEETIMLAEQGVVIADPHSTLVSADVTFGGDVVLWPNVTLLCRDGGAIKVAADTVLFSATRIVANAGEVVIGERCEIGDEGGFTLQVFARDQRILVGNGSRLLGGGSLSLSNELGEGAQVLGPIRAQHCRLGGGGSHRHPEPDERGGVLKGAGVARNIDVPKGHVIQAFGVFADAPMWPQSHFHAKTPKT